MVTVMKEVVTDDVMGAVRGQPRETLPPQQTRLRNRRAGRPRARGCSRRGGERGIEKIHEPHEAVHVSTDKTPPSMDWQGPQGRSRSTSLRRRLRLRGVERYGGGEGDADCRRSCGTGDGETFPSADEAHTGALSATVFQPCSLDRASGQGRVGQGIRPCQGQVGSETKWHRSGVSSWSQAGL